jgi:hypothetical protein
MSEVTKVLLSILFIGIMIGITLAMLIAFPIITIGAMATAFVIILIIRRVKNDRPS